APDRRDCGRRRVALPARDPRAAGSCDRFRRTARSPWPHHAVPMRRAEVVRQGSSLLLGGRPCESSRMRRVLLVAVALLLAMQLVPVARTGRPGAVVRLDAPAEVAAALRLACYDCHSQATVWPWYSRIAPVSWLVAHDVVEGREHLDFSTWDALGPRRKAKLLGEIAK